MPELFSVLDGWQSTVLLSFFPVVSLAPLQDAGWTSTATDNASEKNVPLCFHFMCSSFTAAWLGLCVFSLSELSARGTRTQTRMNMLTQTVTHKY